MSEKAIKLINDLRRDISIDIMFTPEKNAEDDSLKQLVDYIAELEGENAGLKEELQQEKTRSQLNLEAEERRMLNITYYCAEIDRLNARIAELESLVEQLIWVGNDLLVSNTNPVTITLFNGLVCNAKEREE